MAILDTARQYRRVEKVEHPYRKNQIVVSYAEAAKRVGVSRATLMAAALDGVERRDPETGESFFLTIKPVDEIRTGQPGRPALAFLKRDLDEFAKTYFANPLR